MSYHYEVEGSRVEGTGLGALTAAHKLAREYSQAGPVDIVKVDDETGTVVWRKTVPHMPAPVRERKGYNVKTGEIVG